MIPPSAVVEGDDLSAAVFKCRTLSPYAQAEMSEIAATSGEARGASSSETAAAAALVYTGFDDAGDWAHPQVVYDPGRGTLEEWYYDNCEEWVTILDSIDTNVDLYNTSISECLLSLTPDLKSSLTSINFLPIPSLPGVTFNDGNDMVGDSTRFLENLVDHDAILQTGDTVAGCVDFDAIRWTLAQNIAALQVLMQDFLGSLEVAEEAATATTGFAGILNRLGALNDTDAVKAKKGRDAEVAAGVLDKTGGAPVAGPKQEDFKAHLFKEQCFLLAKIFDIVKYKTDVIEKEFSKNLPYLDTGNACLVVEGDPFGFINELTQHSAQSALFDMETKEISSLQPMIRLFKIGERTTGGSETEPKETKEFQQEFLFDANATSADVASVFTDKNKRGFGAGVQNFSFTYEGHTPFAVKKSITAKLTIFANSFGELLADRGGYMYADLALKTGSPLQTDVCEESEVTSALKQINDNLYKLNFRLKAVVGWAPPSGDQSVFTTPGVHDALNESFVTLNLTPVTHEFKLDDMGRVHFTINYLAYIEDFFDQPQFNIFYDPKSTKAMLKRKLLYEAWSEKCSREQFATLKKMDASTGAITAEKNASMRSLIGRLEDTERIYYIPLSFDEIQNFQQEGPFFKSTTAVQIKNISSAAGTAAEGVKDEYINNFVAAGDTSKAATAQREMMTIALEANDPTSGDVAFFYVSDLVDTILEAIEGYLSDYSSQGAIWDDFKNDSEMKDISECHYELEKTAISRFHKNFKKFRAVLGPLEIIDPKGEEDPRFISLGDIPISLKYFIEWLNERMTKKQQSTYFLSRFLNDFFKTLINDFLNDDGCFTFNTSQHMSLNESLVTSYPEAPFGWDEMTEHIIMEGAFIAGTGFSSRLYLHEVKEARLVNGRPLLNISGKVDSIIADPGIANEMNYYIFSAGRTKPAEYMSGNRTIDEQSGIFHYIVGRPRGIVKTIKLNKTEVPYLQEVRFEQDGYDGLQQLREVYDITIDCFSNVKTFPGTYVFVDPRGLDPSTNLVGCDLGNLTQYGIGGYCMIIRSENSFGPGQANTTLTCKWTAEANVDGGCSGGVKQTKPAGDQQFVACDEMLSDRKRALTATSKAAAQAAAADTPVEDSVSANPDELAAFMGRVKSGEFEEEVGAGMTGVSSYGFTMTTPSGKPPVLAYTPAQKAYLKLHGIGQPLLLEGSITAAAGPGEVFETPPDTPY